MDIDKMIKNCIAEKSYSVVNDEKFITWFINYTKQNRVYTDDDYVTDEITSNMLSKIHKLSYEVYIYSCNNYISTDLLLEDDDYFVEYSLVLKIENMYINLKYLVGQGSYVAVMLLNDYEGDYVDFEMLKKKEKTLNAKEIESLKIDITAQMIDWLRNDKVTTKIIKDCIEEIEMSEI